MSLGQQVAGENQCAAVRIVLSDKRRQRFALVVHQPQGLQVPQLEYGHGKISQPVLRQTQHS